MDGRWVNGIATTRTHLTCERKYSLQHAIWCLQKWSVYDRVNREFRKFRYMSNLEKWTVHKCILDTTGFLLVNPKYLYGDGVSATWLQRVAGALSRSVCVLRTAHDRFPMTAGLWMGIFSVALQSKCFTQRHDWRIHLEHSKGVCVMCFHTSPTKTRISRIAFRSVCVSERYFLLWGSSINVWMKQCFWDCLVVRGWASPMYKYICWSVYHHPLYALS